MKDANFFAIFVGIESPDPETLVQMKKKQNTRRNIAESVHKIYGYGMFVTAGFIVGFDTEKGSIGDSDDRLHRGDEHSSLHGWTALCAAWYTADAAARQGRPPAQRP